MKDNSVLIDVSKLSNIAWYEILNGNSLKGVAIYGQVLDVRPNLSSYMNRGIGRLLISDFKGAEEDFRATERFNVTFRVMNVFIGTALYLQGKKDEAAASWDSEISANLDHRITNADGGGVRAPLLLWSLGKAIDNMYYLLRAQKELERLLPKNEDHWIRPLIEYILDERPESEVRESVKMYSEGFNLERRMLVVEYYMTRSSLLTGSRQSLRSSFAQSPQAAISDPEYHLVRQELGV